MKAAIISLGSVSSEYTAQALKEYFDTVDMLDIRNIDIKLGKNPQMRYFKKPLPQYDCAYVKGSFKYSQIASSIVSLLEAQHTYCPIPKQAYLILHDKVLSQIELQKAGVPTPTTYVCPTLETARDILEQLQYPIIIKLPSGTHGKGVLFADSHAAASSILDTLVSLKQAFLIQEYVETGGNDIRAFVIGNQVVAAMKRTAADDEVRSNLHAGGTATPVEIDQKTKTVAIMAARALHLDICGVDILPSIHGPQVIEVNRSPGIQGIMKATGLDVAGMIAEFLYKRSSKQPYTDSQQLIEEDSPSIVAPITYRANRILLPEVISKYADFLDGEEVTITAKNKDITIRKI
jgi:ribosomal protein S6--L-glutamate ligase